MVVEGVSTAKAAYQLAKQRNIEMPITFITYQILFEGLSPQEGVSQLMERMKTHEMEDVVHATYSWK